MFVFEESTRRYAIDRKGQGRKEVIYLRVADVSCTRGVRESTRLSHGGPCSRVPWHAIYEEEQQLELNIAFTITSQGIDGLFYYNTVAIIYICKDYNRFIIFKPYFKPILHSDLLSNIAGIGTVIFKVDIIVEL